MEISMEIVAIFVHTMPDNDADGDGVCGDVDVCPGFDDNVDDDGDGHADGCDFCPYDADNDADADGICGGNIDQCPYDTENDADDDGICGDVDDCPYDAENDFDEDGICGDIDACEGFNDNLDADEDGIPDGCDICPNDASDDSDVDGSCDSDDICPGEDDFLDTDEDTVVDCLDECPLDANDDSDGDGSCDTYDICPGEDDFLDTDGDFIVDCIDMEPDCSTNDTDECGECGGPGITEGTCDCQDSLDTCNVCPYLNPDGYGTCDTTLGGILVGFEDCILIEGCGYGLDEEWFYDTQEECTNSCENCKILNTSDYGDCAVPLGWAFNGNDCEFVEGCGYGNDENWFYDSYDDCMTRCSHNWDSLDNEIELPSIFTLNTYPNPFNPSTNIQLKFLITHMLTFKF